MIRVGIGPQNFKEALNGHKEKGSQEKEEKVNRLRSKVSANRQGKIVVTGVQSQNTHFFAPAATTSTHLNARGIVVACRLST
jgi:hypothetical protein